MRNTSEGIILTCCWMFSGRRLGMALVTALMLVAAPLWSDEPDKVESEFESLRARYQAELDRFYAASEKAQDEQERRRVVNEQYPGNTMVDDFLNLEERHRGTLVGISALHHLVSTGDGEGQGLPKALKVLEAHYHEHRDLDLICAWLDGREQKPFLRLAAKSPHARVRGRAMLELARICAGEAIYPQWIDLKLDLIKDQPERFASDIQKYKRIRGRFAGVDSAVSRREAIQLIDAILQEHGGDPPPRSLWTSPILLTPESISRHQTAGTPSLAAQAESLRFELNHLSIGQPAPEIAGPDFMGRELKLSDQQGKVVVIMFSFKGCGPCEGMYPGNRQLVEAYRGRPFAFVGVMDDKEITTVRQAVDDGTITWPVWWDGGTKSDEKISTRWNVRGWPEIFVLDHRGIIRYREVRGELLPLAVSRLMKEAEAAETP